MSGVGGKIEVRRSLNKRRMMKTRFPSGDQLTFRRKVESGMGKGEWRSRWRLGVMAMKEGWCRQKSEEQGRGRERE